MWSTVLCQIYCLSSHFVARTTTFPFAPLLLHLPSSPTERQHSLCKLQWKAYFLFYLLFFYYFFCNDTQQNDITDIKQEVETQADNLSFFLALCSEHFVLYMSWIFAFGFSFFKTNTCCTSSCIKCTLISLKRVSPTLYLENKYLTQEPTLLLNTVDSLQ